jgi:hypothetical protein
MATNFYFNNFGASSEQNLIEDLIIESIKIYGKDMYYLPRTKNVINSTWNEATLTSYNSHYEIEMYIRNIEGFQGDGEFLSKFGVEVRDQITFTVAQRVWHQEIGDIINYQRPLEGDCIYFTLTNALYQIKFVNVKPIFYQLGALQTYDIVCELYEGNSDRFNTGLQEIDSLYNSFTLSQDSYDLLTEDGLFLLTQEGEYIIDESYSLETIVPIAQNDMFVAEGADFIDFTEIDPFSERST